MREAQSMYRRKRQSAMSKSGAGAGGVILLIVLLLCAIVYLWGAEKAGAWMANNVVLPIMGKLNTPSPSDTIGSTGQSVQDATVTPGLQEQTPPPNAVKQHVVFPALDFYAIQLGVFSAENSARDEADAFQLRGAAGYVIFDQKWRILGSAYPSKDEAESVKSSLLAQGIDAYIYHGSAGEVALNITASQSQIDALTKAMQGWREAVDGLMTLSLAIDKGDMSQSAAIASLTTMQTEILSQKAALGTSENTLLVKARSLFDSYDQSCKEIMQENDQLGLAISTKIKYNHIHLLFSYVEFVNSLIGEASA